MTDLLSTQSKHTYPQNIFVSPVSAAIQYTQSNILRWFIRWYWWIFTIIAFVTVVFETIEHLTTDHQGSPFYYSEIILINLLLIATGLLVKKLLDSLADRSHLINLLSQKNELSMRLSDALEHDAAPEQIIRFVSGVVPAAAAELYLPDESTQQFRLAANASPAALSSNQAQLNPGLNHCLLCLTQRDRASHAMTACQRVAQPSKGQCQLHCLSFQNDRRVVGMLHLKMPPNETLSSPQIELLDAVNQEITHTLAAAREKKTQAEKVLSQAVRSVQLDIAKDLHDTIGQNISFLNMRLGHIADTGILENTHAIAEIQQMRAIAEESYDMVRGTLAVLKTEDASSLESVLEGHARMIAARSGIKVDISTHGQPQALTPKVLRQLFYIFREALSNIEKHACASFVSVDIIWEPSHLSLTVSDNGHGFNTEQIRPNGHYGLEFMRVRAENLQGQFSLRSVIGGGTDLMVNLPIN